MSKFVWIDVFLKHIHAATTRPIWMKQKNHNIESTGQIHGKIHSYRGINEKTELHAGKSYSIVTNCVHTKLQLLLQNYIYRHL